MSFSTAAITYNMVKFHPGFFRQLYACLDLLLSIAAVESSMMVIAAFVPNFMLGIIIGAGFIVRFISLVVSIYIIPKILNEKCPLIHDL